MTIAVLLLGAGCAFLMRPERPFDEPLLSTGATEPAAAE